jgi:hypothetical protein
MLLFLYISRQYGDVVAKTIGGIILITRLLWRVAALFVVLFRIVLKFFVKFAIIYMHTSLRAKIGNALSIMPLQFSFLPHAINTADRVCTKLCFILTLSL